MPRWFSHKTSEKALYYSFPKVSPQHISAQLGRLSDLNPGSARFLKNLLAAVTSQQYNVASFYTSTHTDDASCQLLQLISTFF